jgi:hypothetical protein
LLIVLLSFTFNVHLANSTQSPVIDSPPESSGNVEHNLCKLFLDENVESNFMDFVVMMASGKTLADLGEQFSSDDRFMLFTEFIGGFANLNCSEQGVEGDHATMHRTCLRAPRSGEAYKSTELRFPYLEGLLETDPQAGWLIVLTVSMNDHIICYFVNFGRRRKRLSKTIR